MPASQKIVNTSNTGLHRYRTLDTEVSIQFVARDPADVLRIQTPLEFRVSVNAYDVCKSYKVLLSAQGAEVLEF